MGFVACAGAAPPPPEPVVVGALTRAPVAEEVPPPVVQDGAFGLPRPSTVACRYDGDAPGRLVLRLEASGTPYAFVYQHRQVVVRVPVGAPTGMHIELEAEEIELSGVLAPRDYPLHLTAGRLVAGVLFVESDAVITWVGGSPSQLSVEVPAPNELTLLGGETRRLEVPCAGVSHRVHTFDLASTAGLSDSPRPAELAAALVDIAPERAASSTARLDLRALGDAARQVAVYERVDGRARIVWSPPRSPTRVVGWVDDSQLAFDRPPLASYRQGRGSGRGRGRAGAERPLRCEHPLALYARLGEVERLVGRVPAMHPIVRVPTTTPGRARVRFSSIRPAPGAELLVSLSDVSDCQR